MKNFVTRYHNKDANYLYIFFLRTYFITIIDIISWIELSTERVSGWRIGEWPDDSVVWLAAVIASPNDASRRNEVKLPPWTSFPS
jgi:hypothetical protein